MKFYIWGNIRINCIIYIVIYYSIIRYSFKSKILRLNYLIIHASLYLFILLFIYTLIYQYWILYSDDYFNLVGEIVNVGLQLITARKGIPLCILFYYLVINAGFTITLISIKVFITVTIMIGNIIDIYLLGIIVILINWIPSSSYFGLVIIGLLPYIFLTKIELSLLILYIMESFSSIFQSLTLANLHQLIN